MTLKDFLSNPAGKGDTAMSFKLIANMLDNKYDALMKKKGNLLKYSVYKVLGKEIYYFHLIIPTETDRDNTYDVVIELSDLEGAHGKDNTIAKYDARFFSNAPSFAFTFAKVYLDNHVLITDLAGKFTREQITQNPDVRNRRGIVGYDKYLYFGVKYIYETGILSKSSLQYQASRYSKMTFVPQIRSLERILQEYHRAEGKLKKKRVSQVRQTLGLDKPTTKPKKSLKGDAGIYKKPKDKITPTGPKKAKSIRKS